MNDIFCKYTDSKCERCGKVCSKPRCISVCPALVKVPIHERAELPNGGPGTELKKLLAELGISSFEGCSCDSHVAQMDRWGVTGCREHFEEIRGWIAEAQAKAGWLTTITAAGRAATSGLALQLDPLDIPGSLVRLAIERAENTKKESP